MIIDWPYNHLFIIYMILLINNLIYLWNDFLYCLYHYYLCMIKFQVMMSWLLIYSLVLYFLLSFISLILSIFSYLIYFIIHFRFNRRDHPSLLDFSLNWFKANFLLLHCFPQGYDYLYYFFQFVNNQL